MNPKKPLSPLANLNHSKRPPRASKWISGKELIARWGILGFELFNFMKEGLQAYTPHGKKIIDSDSLDRNRPLTLDQVKNNLRAKQNARVLGNPGTGSRPPLTESNLNYRAKRIYESQSLKKIEGHFP